MDDVVYRPIGVIHTPFPGSKDVPRGADARDAPGTIEVFPRYAAGLDDLGGFSHVIIVFHMHLSEGPLLKVRPRNQRSDRGVFSTRSPRRPNPVGITVVRLKRIEGNILHVEGVDMADHTPLIDIKPYIPELDGRAGARTGWNGRRMANLAARKAGSGKK
jgi:tRNA-Thr(GGU) m(6)t(6)A37 methyltransferase TsaA